MSSSDVGERVARLTATYPGFPDEGVVFRDLTPVFADPETFRAIVDDFQRAFSQGFDAVAGIEARGFLLASALAYTTGASLLTVRKEGKLPGSVLSADYSLEYGTATLQVGADAVPHGARVLIVDDVLATGGSAYAAARLMEKAGAQVAGIGIVMELPGLGGRERLEPYRLHVQAVDDDRLGLGEEG